MKYFTKIFAGVTEEKSFETKVFETKCLTITNNSYQNTKNYSYTCIFSQII